jgi:hypothetical protein
MSLVSALAKIRDTLRVDDLNELVLGIPELLQNAPLPAFYLDVGVVSATYNDLQPTDQTESFAPITIKFQVEMANIPQEKEWYLWPHEIAEAIVAKIEQDTIDRVYETSDRGFELRTNNWFIEYDSKQAGPIATGTMNLTIGGFL